MKHIKDKKYKNKGRQKTCLPFIIYYWVKGQGLKFVTNFLCATFDVIIMKKKIGIILRIGFSFKMQGRRAKIKGPPC